VLYRQPSADGRRQSRRIIHEDEGSPGLVEAEGPDAVPSGDLPAAYFSGDLVHSLHLTGSDPSLGPDPLAEQAPYLDEVSLVHSDLNGGRTKTPHAPPAAVVRPVIGQLMRGRLDVRDIEDIGDAALSYAEVKALAAGDPRLIELVHPGFPGDSGPWIPGSLVVLSCAA